MRQDWITERMGLLWIDMSLGKEDGGPRAASLNVMGNTTDMWLWVRIGEDYDDLFSPAVAKNLQTRSAIKRAEEWVTKGIGVSEWDVATAIAQHDAYMREHHTIECIAGTAHRKALIRAWKTNYPNYCRICYGAGMFESSFDPSPSGVSLSPGSITDCEPCGACTEQDKCARCMAPLYSPENTVGEGPCGACGWNYDDMMPPVYECNCWGRDGY